MLQSMLSRRRSTGTQVRTEDPDAFATIPVPDPDSMFRRIVSNPVIRFFGWRTNSVVLQMEPPIRPPPRALDNVIHPGFPLPSPQSPHLPPATSSSVERRDSAPWNDPPFELNRTPSFHQRRRLPVPLPIQRQREAEEFNSRTHADHLRSRTSSPWSTYETNSYDEVRGQRELGRSRRELHDLLTRRTRVEVARRLLRKHMPPGRPPLHPPQRSRHPTSLPGLLALGSPVSSTLFSRNPARDSVGWREPRFLAP
jgi:hypothetical protein